MNASQFAFSLPIGAEALREISLRSPCLSADIDERKKAEDQRRRSEGYLSAARSLSHDGSAAYVKPDAKGQYLKFPCMKEPSRPYGRRRIG
jgi:hypothetical protein